MSTEILAAIRAMQQDISNIGQRLAGLVELIGGDEREPFSTPPPPGDPITGDGWIDTEKGLQSQRVDRIAVSLSNLHNATNHSLRQRAKDLLKHPVFNSVFVGRMHLDEFPADYQRDITDSLARIETVLIRAGGPHELKGARDVLLPPLIDYRDQTTWLGYTARKPGPAIEGVLLVPFSQPGDTDAKLATFVQELVDDYLANGPKNNTASWV